MDTYWNNCNNVWNWYAITAIILTLLLIISELLAWSKCDANGVTQIHRCLYCCKKVKDINIENPTISPEEWSE